MQRSPSSPKSRPLAKTGSDLLIRSSLPDWVVRTILENRIRRMSQLAGMSDRELLALDGIGHRAVALIRAEQARQAHEGGLLVPVSGDAARRDDGGDRFGP